MMKFDYSLAVWFSKTKDKIIPGTAFLFLNKVTFLLVALILIFIKSFSLVIGGMSLSITLMAIALFVMYGFQKRTERFVRNRKFEKEYLKLSKTTIKSRRLTGLLLLIICYVIIFMVVAMFF